MPAEKLEKRNLSVDDKKKKFFGSFALKHLSAFKLHKEFGLLPQEEGWANVSRHQMVEAAAVEELAEMLQLPKPEVQKLVYACLIHDFYKRKEVELMRKEGITFESEQKAEAEATNALLDRELDPDVIKLVEAVGPSNIDRMRGLGVTLGEKIMFYIDNIVDNDRIVTPEERMRPLPARYPGIANTGLLDQLLEISESIERELAERAGIPEGTPLSGAILTRLNERIASVQ